MALDLIAQLLHKNLDGSMCLHIEQPANSSSQKPDEAIPSTTFPPPFSLFQGALNMSENLRAFINPLHQLATHIYNVHVWTCITQESEQ